MYINELMHQYAKEQAEIIDNTVFDFLKANGYRPKKTEKYIKNLKKKLDKQGLAIKIDEVVLEEKYDGLRYIKRCIYVPSFVSIKQT